MSDKAQPGRSRVPATRRYADAMQALEDAGSPHAVPIREYVRQLRNEAHKYRTKARALRQQQEDSREDRE